MFLCNILKCNNKKKEIMLLWWFPLLSPLSVSTDSEIEQESVMEIDIDTILPRPPIK